MQSENKKKYIFFKTFSTFIEYFILIFKTYTQIFDIVNCNFSFKGFIFAFCFFFYKFFENF